MPVSFSLGNEFKIIFSILIELKYVFSGILMIATNIQSSLSAFLFLIPDFVLVFWSD